MADFRAAPKGQLTQSWRKQSLTKKRAQGKLPVALRQKEEVLIPSWLRCGCGFCVQWRQNRTAMTGSTTGMLERSEHQPYPY